MINRGISASFVAPPVAMFVFWAGAIGAIRAFDGTLLPPGAASYSLFYFSFFGIPITYLGAVALALPAYRALRRRGCLRPTTVIASAAALGALWAALIVFVVLGPPEQVPIPSQSDWAVLAIAALLGALGGAIGAATFALLRGDWPTSRPAS